MRGWVFRTGAASIAALAAAASAAAAPALLVTPTSRVLGAAAGAVIATHQDASAYRTTVSAPAAWGLRAGNNVGQTVGAAVVQVTTAVGALTFAGWITGESPAGFVNDDCAAFAGYDHLAVYLMQVRQVDGLARAEIPIFVDAGPGGTTLLTWCAASAADMTVTDVTVRLTRSLVNPIVHGVYAWRANFDLAGGDVSTVGIESTSAVSRVRF
jgi:hypothetical protein